MKTVSGKNTRVQERAEFANAVVVERFIVTKNMAEDEINVSFPYLTEKEKEFVDYDAYKRTFMCYENSLEHAFVDTGVFLEVTEAKAAEDLGSDASTSCSMHDKPRCSYADLIKSALESSCVGKLTLSEIYSWIRQKHPFFRTGDLVWQNSIRHNLSLNKTFKKIPRESDSVGKGGYWAIDESFVPKKAIRVRKKRKRSTQKQQAHNEENIAPCDSSQKESDCTGYTDTGNGENNLAHPRKTAPK